MAINNRATLPKSSATSGANAASVAGQQLTAQKLNVNRKEATISDSQAKAEEYTVSDPLQFGMSGVTLMSKNMVDMVYFENSPSLTESGAAIFETIAEHKTAQPASILKYNGTPSREFQLNVKLISRTVEEAQKNHKNIHILKSWRMPPGANGNARNANGAEGNIGPDIVRLFAYGKYLKGIPTVMKNLTIEYPDDVDYIDIDADTSVPIIQSISISLTETRTVDDIGTFNIAGYKSGSLPTW